MSLRTVAGKIVNSDVGWKMIRPIVKAGSFFQWKRKEMEDARAKKAEDDFKEEATKTFDKIFADRTVLHGPFKGLKYPSMDSVGSGLYPKLIGSYERELNALFELICRQKYSEILDIGCAEGYYAVGCSIRIPTAKIFAYDISDKARILCQQMAIVNGADNVTIRSACTPEELAEFNFTNRGLIICDCEGYEYELFNEENVSNLKKCDLLIEVHDFLNPNISPRLRTLFSNTHEISVIRSISDKEKAMLYHYNESENLSPLLKKILFKEGRPGIMEWLLMASGVN